MHPSIQLEIDCPSNHEDGKVPILDLKVWIEDIRGVVVVVCTVPIHWTRVAVPSSVEHYGEAVLHT